MEIDTKQRASYHAYEGYIRRYNQPVIRSIAGMLCAPSVETQEDDDGCDAQETSGKSL